MFARGHPFHKKITEKLKFDGFVYTVFDFWVEKSRRKWKYPNLKWSADRDL